MNQMSLLIAILLWCSACQTTTQDAPPSPGSSIHPLYFPPANSSEWATTTPQSLGWNTAQLLPLYDYLAAQDTRAFLVLKDGKIVLEKYFGKTFNNAAPFAQNSPWYWASAGKTLTSFVVGKAQQEGRLNINAKTSQYLGVGWTSLPLAKENLITVRHQLSMTSGLDDTGNLDNTTPSALLYKADAGTRWSYHNAPYTLLQNVVSQATGQSFTSYFEVKLKAPIGMDGQWIAGDYERVYWSTARSMARFGLLMQAKASWNGQAILDDPTYYQASLSASQSLNFSYGYLWWLNGQTSYRVPQSQLVFSGSLSPAAPADLVAAVGKGGQLLNIVPSQGLVVVRMGDSINTGLVSLQLQNTLWEYLSAVIK